MPAEERRGNLKDLQALPAGRGCPYWRALLEACWRARLQDVTKGGQLSAATVIIQYTAVGTSKSTEYGSRPPYDKTTGSGGALVLRDGGARGSRPSADGGSMFTTASGQPMTFAPGPVWVVLAAH